MLSFFSPGASVFNDPDSTGDLEHVVSTGPDTRTLTEGDEAHTAAVGDHAVARTAGVGSHAATTGMGSAAVTGGMYSHAATVGGYSVAVTSEEEAHAAGAGLTSYAATFGFNAHAFSPDGAAEAHRGVAVGRWARLNSSDHSAVLLPADASTHQPCIISVAAGHQLGVWYTLVDGEPVAHPEVIFPPAGSTCSIIFDGNSYTHHGRAYDADEILAMLTDRMHRSPVWAEIAGNEIRAHIARRATTAP